jgi:transcriptional regulator with XRE-family HTH domain
MVECGMMGGANISIGRPRRSQAVTAAQSRTVRRRRLGDELRRLREARGMTIEEAATALECSHSRVSLIENGKQGSRPKDVREMAHVYGLADPAQVGALENLAKQTGEKGWWAAYEGVLPAKFSTYVDLETDARDLLAYSPLTVHGLLQTEDYARVVIRTPLQDPAAERVDRLVELRKKRQTRLTGQNPLIASFVLDEGALRRLIGGREIMREQLRHLLDVAEQPNITIQTLPFAKGAHASLDGSFVILRFPDAKDDGDVVYIEGPAGNIYLESTEHVRSASSRFDRLRVLAQDEEESKAFITTILEEL